MPKFQRSLARRIFVTAHKLILDSLMHRQLRRLKGRVLVVGAGFERYSDLIPMATEVVTTDITPIGNVKVLADAHFLPFGDNSFDGYVAMEVLEHLYSPKTASTEVLRVLKPGGIAILSVPFLFRVHGDPNDFRRYTKAGLLGLFENFIDLEITEFGNRWHVISDLITTSTKYLIPLRLANNIFRLQLLNTASIDAPSGYLITFKKES